MELTATIEVNDETITVSGHVYHEVNERGAGLVVLLDDPHDGSEYAYEAEEALIAAYEAQTENHDGYDD